MPVVDMSVEKLKVYQGVNPRPADFDAYWDEALAEMKATDAQIEYVDADFQAPGLICKHLYFTGVGGARIHANFARPEKIQGKCPGMVWFHGYTGSAPDFMQLLPYAYAGFVIASLDVRGQGGLSEDSQAPAFPTVYGHIVKGLHGKDPKNLFFRNVFLDAAQLAGIVMDMEEVDETRVGAMGGSQGGALTLACASLEPRIARAVPTFPWLCDYKRVWDMDLDTHAYQGLRDYFRHFDPNHEHEEEVFTKLGYIDLQFLAPRIKAKIMMGTGLLDNICPPSSQFAAFNKITSEKQVVFFPDFGHEGLPGWPEKTFTFMKELL